MSELHEYLVEWLNTTFNPLEELVKQGIKVSTDGSYPNLYNLKYGPVVADKSSPLIRACRGAVIERVDNDGDHSPYFRLVSYAFDRFFNLGEGSCHTLNWNTTKVYEKYDGSLMVLVNYKGNWVVSTSGTVAAGAKVGNSDKTFADLFWYVFDEVGYSKESLNPNLCYIFELCHRDNRVVVEYLQPQLPLLAVRDCSKNFIELDLDETCELTGLIPAKSYDFGSLEGLMAVINNRGADHEGFVLYDGVGRVKLKSSLYCQLHLAVNNGGPSFSKLYLSGDLDEFLLYFPSYSGEFNSHSERISKLNYNVDATLKEYSHLNQKEFALMITSKSDGDPFLPAACFAIRSGKVETFEQWVEGLTPKKLDAMLDVANAYH